MATTVELPTYSRLISWALVARRVDTSSHVSPSSALLTSRFEQSAKATLLYCRAPA